VFFYEILAAFSRQFQFFPAGLSALILRFSSVQLQNAFEFFLGNIGIILNDDSLYITGFIINDVVFPSNGNNTFAHGLSFPGYISLEAPESVCHLIIEKTLSPMLAHKVAANKTGNRNSEKNCRQKNLHTHITLQTNF
jgi:hypothetical protein